VRVVVNGEERELPVGVLGELIRHVGAQPDGVAVAVNGEVVPRSERASRPLRDGDKVEIIRAVGGG
jgi:sulfur carrier protein